MTVKSETRQRILSAAIELFSKHGYNGASTRDVASLANVNEVTVYRNYASKKALFVAAVESELSKVSFSMEAITAMAGASDSRQALNGIFGLIAQIVERHPEMIRLLQFAALELGDDLAPIFKQHIERLIEVSADYLKYWFDMTQSPGVDPRVLILAFISTVAGVGSWYPVLSGTQSSMSARAQGSVCTEIWSNALYSHSSNVSES